MTARENSSYAVITAGGNVQLDITEASPLLTSVMPEMYSLAEFYIAFYNEAGNAVDPAGGTILVEGSPIAGQFHSSFNVTDALDATLCGPSGAYTIPYFAGRVIQGRITFSGITSGTGSANTIAYASAVFWRSFL